MKVLHQYRVWFYIGVLVFVKVVPFHTGDVLGTEAMLNQTSARFCIVLA